MYQVIYRPTAERSLEHLDPAVAIRIVRKVEYYSRQPDPLRFAKRLRQTSLGEYRFRVGDYRVLFDVDRKDEIQILSILKVGHRSEIYE